MKSSTTYDTVGCIVCLVDIGNAHILTAQLRFTTCITNLHHQPESNIHTSSTFLFVPFVLQPYISLLPRNTTFSLQ